MVGKLHSKQLFWRILHWHQGTNKICCSQIVWIKEPILTVTNHMPLLMISIIKHICVIVFLPLFRSVCVFLSEEGQSVAGKLTQGPCCKVVPFIWLRHFWNPSKRDTLHLSGSLGCSLGINTGGRVSIYLVSEGMSVSCEFRVLRLHSLNTVIPLYALWLDFAIHKSQADLRTVKLFLTYFGKSACSFTH